jgi:predicted transcriptional regulator
MPELKLKSINKPVEDDLEKDINWVCNAFCLSSGRDTDSSANRIVVDILKKISNDEIIFSDTIADDLNMTRDLVNHHLRRLINQGVVVREKKQITIRGGSLKEAVLEIKKDAIRLFDSIETIADDIDVKLGISNRKSL